MKELKKGITIMIPAKNEEHRIKDCILQFKKYADAIIVVEDGSTDRTVEIAKKYANKVIQLDPSKLSNPTHQVQVYNEGLKYVETEWILTADCDEIWDKGFLEHMKEIIAKKPHALCFRFPRLNMPVGKDFPDYQTRLVKTACTVWKHEPHIIPYLKGKDVPLDQTDHVETLDNFPILHLPRRTDKKRPWWNEK